MILIRFFYGLVLGVTLPISLMMLSEITEKHLRGRMTITLQFFFILGKIYLLILAIIFMTSIDKGNWRAVALGNAIPCFFMLIGNYFFLDESARYLIVNN